MEATTTRVGPRDRWVSGRGRGRGRGGAGEPAGFHQFTPRVTCAPPPTHGATLRRTAEGVAKGDGRRSSSRRGRGSVSSARAFASATRTPAAGSAPEGAAGAHAETVTRTLASASSDARARRESATSARSARRAASSPRRRERRATRRARIAAVRRAGDCAASSDLRDPAGRGDGHARERALVQAPQPRRSKRPRQRASAASSTGTTEPASETPRSPRPRVSEGVRGTCGRTLGEKETEHPEKKTPRFLPGEPSVVLPTGPETFGSIRARAKSSRQTRGRESSTFFWQTIESA